MNPLRSHLLHWHSVHFSILESIRRKANSCTVQSEIIARIIGVNMKRLRSFPLVAVVIILVFLMSFFVYITRKDYHLLRTYNISGIPSAVDISENGDIIAAGDADGNIIVWDTKTSKVINTIQAHKQRITAIQLISTRNMLISVSADGKAKWWNIQNGQEIFSHTRITPNTDISGADNQGNINVVSGGLYTLALNHSKSLIATGGESGQIIILKTSNGDRISSVQGHQVSEGNDHYYPVMHLYWSLDDRFLISISAPSGGLSLWKVDNDKIQLLFNKKINYWIDSPYLGQANNTLLLLANINELLALSLEDGRQIEATKMNIRGFSSSIFTEDGKKLAYGGYSPTFSDPLTDVLPFLSKPDGNIYIVDTKEMSSVFTLRGHDLKINDLSISKNQLFLVSCSDDKTIRLWYLATGVSSF